MILSEKYKNSILIKNFNSNYIKERKNMEKLPVFISLEGKKILVVGGGNAALIKIKTLLDIKANFTVIAKTFSEQTEELLQKYYVNYQKREISQQDLKDIFIVFAAAEKNINDRIAKWAEQQNIL